MVNPLFDRVLPQELANCKQVIDCKGDIGSLERLTEIVEADIAAVSGDVGSQGWRAKPIDIRLEFGWADGVEGISAITGSASAHIPAVCQRCLKVFELALDTSIKVLLVRLGDSLDVADYEVWELEEETLQLADIVEESLVMAMPLAPTHESMESCVALAVENTDSGSETARPFADLRSQLEKTNN